MNQVAASVPASVIRPDAASAFGGTPIIISGRA
jgi:hypothetical protein